MTDQADMCCEELLADMREHVGNELDSIDLACSEIRGLAIALTQIHYLKAHENTARYPMVKAQAKSKMVLYRAIEALADTIMADVGDAEAMME